MKIFGVGFLQGAGATAGMAVVTAICVPLYTKWLTKVITDLEEFDEK